MNKSIIALLFFLLMILSGTKAPGWAKATGGKVLVVLSSTRTLTLKNGVKHPTGFFLNELGVPLKSLVDAGFEPVFCDPLGNEPTMDTISDKPSYFEHNEQKYESIKSFVDGLPALKHPQSLSSVAKGNLDQYAGLFVPGGHAPMEDLWQQPALGKILRYFHDRGKPTALICHGPIALLSALNDPKALVDSVENKTAAQKTRWPYAGYHMTVFSDAEERPNEPGRLGGFMLFFPEDALRAAGGNVRQAPPKQSNVVVDRELITGQNPFSDEELSAAFLKALSDRN